MDRVRDRVRIRIRVGSGLELGLRGGTTIRCGLNLI